LGERVGSSDMVWAEALEANRNAKAPPPRRASLPHLL